MSRSIAQSILTLGWRLGRRLARDKSGNTTAMIAAGVTPLLALLGGGIDMGRSYLSQSRLQQACDAGVLAARKKLGSTVVTNGTVPQDVAEVGNRFFNLNFRDGSYGTDSRAFQMTLEPDNSISGIATVDVPTTIMRIFGYQMVPVQVECEAILNFSDTDLMMVLDVTGSMSFKADPADPKTKIATLRDVVRDFYNQVEASKGPGIRVRYGFVPYSTNVNVGASLEDDWVVDTWTYQTREIDHTDNSVVDYTYWANFVYISGSSSTTTITSYPATYHASDYETGSAYYTCDTSPPPSTYVGNYTLLSTTTEPYAGPPAGTKTTQHYRRVINGSSYWVQLSGTTCTIMANVYNNYTDEYDQITIPQADNKIWYRYAPIERDVSNWRTETNGCIEERGTYEISDYDNVNLNQAMDLDIDLVPTVGNPATQWRPQYPNIIYERKLNNENSNAFEVPEVIEKKDYFKPSVNPGLVACPAPAMRLTEISDVATIDAYLNPIVPNGATYHDIGMIWGGRFISPTGIFAADNADRPGRSTNRHLIFLTDGLTETFDIAYGAYGVEPLDRRRWNHTAPVGGLTQNQMVEERFKIACAEVKKKNVTVWVISFGVTMTDMLSQCAGDDDHAFQANNASELSEAFAAIAASMGDLRLSM